MLGPAGRQHRGLGRLQCRQRFLVGHFGTAQAALGDGMQALLLDADGAIPGGIDHDRDRQRSGQHGQYGAADDDPQSAHDRGSREVCRAGHMGGAGPWAMAVYEHGAGLGGMGQMR
ncbi:hypothetical protein D3C80_1628930 [compost metagenome]